MSFVNPIKIGEKYLGRGYPSYIIFEVASTHGNDWNIAKAYVRQAKKAGADALKFQLFRAEGLLNPITTGLKSTYDFFKKSEIPLEWFPKLIKLCDESGIDFLCTPFDEESAIFLNQIGMPAFKIASGDLTNHHLLSLISGFNKPVILSTGMATMSEVKAAVNVLRNNGSRDLAILQCTSVYPMPYKAANLNAMLTFEKEFRSVVGYSDNGSEGFVVDLAAVAMGASIIEKHVTGKKKVGNKDDVFSLSVEEFSEMVKEIRGIERTYGSDREKALDQLKEKYGKDINKMLGSSQKKPSGVGHLREDGVYMTENSERHWARRGIYPKIIIPKGTVITREMIISLRPDVGVSALDFGKIVGAVANEELLPFKPIKIRGGRVNQFKKLDVGRVYKKKQDKDFAKILFKEALF
jgi:N,N'-diacetyllegionaminate synthase